MSEDGYPRRRRKLVGRVVVWTVGIFLVVIGSIYACLMIVQGVESAWSWLSAWVSTWTGTTWAVIGLACYVVFPSLLTFVACYSKRDALESFAIAFMVFVILATTVLVPLCIYYLSILLDIPIKHILVILIAGTPSSQRGTGFAEQLRAEKAETFQTDAKQAVSSYGWIRLVESDLRVHLDKTNGTIKCFSLRTRVPDR